MLDKLVHTNMGKYAGKFANYIATLFLFIADQQYIGYLRIKIAHGGLRHVTFDAGADHICHDSV